MSTPLDGKHMLAQLLFAWGQSCTYWGNKLLSKRFYVWALGSYTRAHTLDPEWSRPLLRRGVIRGREFDDYTGAVKDLTQVISEHPEYAEAYLQRGLLHAFHGFQSAQRAIDDFEHFLSLAPQHSWRDEAQHQINRLQADIAERQLAKSLDLQRPR